MNTCHNLMVFTIIAIISMGCGEKSIIKSEFKAQTINQQRDFRPYQFTISLNKLKVDDLEGTDNIPLVGKAFKLLTSQIANLFINGKKGKEIEIDPVTYHIPELENISLEKVKSLFIQHFLLTSLKNTKGKRTSLDFINELHVYIYPGDKAAKATELLDLKLQKISPINKSSKNEIDDDVVAELAELLDGGDNQEKEKTDEIILGTNRAKVIFKDQYKVLSYSKLENIGSIGCQKKCLDLAVDMDPELWKSILAEHSVYRIEIELKINSIPKGEIILDGLVGINVQVELPL